MGSPITKVGSAEYRSCEKPQHFVTVSEFYMGRFLVTAEEFCLFLNAVGNQGYFLNEVEFYDKRRLCESSDRYIPQLGAERCPAYPVTWVGAVRYCEWLSKRLGRDVRLPSEAEWELVARGKELREWPWGNEESIHGFWGLSPEDRAALEEECDQQDENASAARRTREIMQLITKPVPWFYVRGLGSCGLYFDEKRPWFKAPVGSFALGATPDGVYDMLGYYAGQWCSDRFDEEAYERQSEQRQAHVGPDDDIARPGKRVMRGVACLGVDRKTYRPPLLPLIGKGYPGSNGRSWSREAGDARQDGGIFRIAMDGNTRQ